MRPAAKPNSFRATSYSIVIAFVSIVLGLVFVLEVQANPGNQNNPPLLVQVHRPEWEGNLIDVDFSPDAKLVAIAGVDKDLLIYDATTLTEMARLKGHSDKTISVSWSQSGYLAASSRDKTVRVWDDQFQPVTVLPEHDGWIVEVAWSPDGQKLATLDEVTLYAYATGTWATQGMLRIWDIANIKIPLITFEAPRDAAWAIDWNADGTRIAAAGKYAHGIRIWNVQTGEMEHLFTYTFGWTTRITAFAWSLDDKGLAVGDVDGYVQIWDIETGETVNEEICGDVVSDLEWRTDRRLTSACYDSCIPIWHPHTSGIWQLLGEEKSGEEFVSVDWSSDGNKLIAGAKTGTIAIWDTSNLPSLEGLPTAIPPKDWNP